MHASNFEKKKTIEMSDDEKNVYQVTQAVRDE